VVTVDTTTKPSTAALNVTRNHEKDKRGAEKVEEVAMAPQVSTIQGQRPPQPSTPVVLTHLQHGAKEERFGGRGINLLNLAVYRKTALHLLGINATVD
jgi:hypothetical protein